MKRKIDLIKFVFVCIISLCATKALACDPVTNVQTSPTSNSVAIFWTMVPGAMAYEYVVDMSPSNPTVAGAFTMTPNGTQGALSSGTTYYAHVRTQCNTGTSTWVTVSFTTTGTSCNAPSYVIATPTNNSVSWEWATVMGTGYEYIIDNSSSVPVTNGTFTMNTTGSQNGLAPGTTYYLHVRTQCNSGYSTWAIQSFTTTGSTCPAPSNIVTTPTSNAVSWQWTNVGGTGYEYVIDNSSSAPSTNGTFTTSTTGNQNGLTAGTNYYLHVRTQCGTDYSAWVNQLFTTIGNLVAPTNIIITPSYTSATFSWNSVTNATGYEYIVNTSSAAPTGAGIPTSMLSASQNGLTSSTNYYLHLRSKGPGSTYSSWANQPFMTLTPTEVSGLKKSDFSISLFPNPVDDVLGLIIVNPDLNAKAVLVDLNGKVVKEIIISSTSVRIDLTDFSSGIYLFRYTDNTHNKNISITKK